MSLSTQNPYPIIGTQYATALAAIIAGLPGTPTISDLVLEVYTYIAGTYYTGSLGPPNTQVKAEINSSIYHIINSYINGLVPSGQSTLSPKTMGFASMLLSSPVEKNLPIYLTNWIGDVEDNISKAGLTVDEQRPLLLATELGNAAYTYWRTETLAGGSSAWAAYFILNNNDYNSIPYWVAASMEGALAGYGASFPGLIEPTVNQYTTTMVAALTGALTIAAGKVVFGWIPRIQPAQVAGGMGFGMATEGLIGAGLMGGGSQGPGGFGLCISDSRTGVHNLFGQTYHYRTYCNGNGQDNGGSIYDSSWSGYNTDPIG